GPYDFFADSSSPNRSCFIHTSKQIASLDVSCRAPDVDGLFNPRGNRNSSHMAAFAYQVDDGPVFLTLLQMFHRQMNQLGPPQTAAEQQRQHREVSLSPDRIPGRNTQKSLPLLRGEPVSEAYAE